MDKFDDAYRQKVAAVVRGVLAAKYAKDDNVPIKIEEGLFLGSVGVAQNREALKELNITHILTVAHFLPLAHPDDFTYKTIEVVDCASSNLEQYFDECFNFIDGARQAGGGVLVHCFAGRSRSVTIVVAYLMKKYLMSLSQALDLVRSKRPSASPNIGFMMQLQKFEKLLEWYKIRKKQLCSGQCSNI